MTPNICWLFINIKMYMPEEGLDLFSSGISDNMYIDYGKSQRMGTVGAQVRRDRVRVAALVD